LINRLIAFLAPYTLSVWKHKICSALPTDVLLVRKNVSANAIAVRNLEVFSMLSLAAKFILGLLYANVGEWLVHKYILHGLGKDRHSFWAYHWYEHHAICGKNSMLDPGYQSIHLTKWNAQTKELSVLTGIALLHVPLLILFPVFTAALYASLMIYYYKHRKAHLNPAWAKHHLPWHYDHHLGGHCSANWCITWPWFDYLMGTRVKYKAK
jgi:hypothetical protein